MKEIKFYDCSPDLCIGLAKVIATINDVPSYRISTDTLTVKAAGHYVTATDVERTIKHRLDGCMPFEIILHRPTTKYALQKIRNKTVKGIGKYKNNIIFNFGDVRVSIPEYQSISDEICNLLCMESGPSYSEINKHMPLFLLPVNIKKVLKSGYKYADFFSINFSQNRLTIKTDESIGLKAEWKVKRYGSEVGNITLVVDPYSFYKSINNGALMGFHRFPHEENLYQIFIHNKKSVSIVPGLRRWLIKGYKGFREQR